MKKILFKILNKIKLYYKGLYINIKQAGWKKITIYFSTIIIAILLLFLGRLSKGAYGKTFFTKLDPEYTVKVEVLSIEDVKWEDETEYEDSIESKPLLKALKCKILTGEEKGIETWVLQIFYSEKKELSISASEGDKIYVSKGIDETYANPDYDYQWTYSGHVDYIDRTDKILIFVVFFIIIILLFARFQGFNTILALFLSLAFILVVFIPAVLTFKNIYLWTFITSAYVITVTLLLVIGANKKALCAGIGCFSGIIIMAILTLIARGLLSLSGAYTDTQVLYEIYMNYGYYWDLKGLIFAIFTLGSIGAVIDTGVSLSSSLYEMYLSSVDHSPKKLIKSGLVIGKDMLGTMANTLVLAYLGSSLLVTLITIKYNGSLENILRSEMFSHEIAQAIVGTLGMLACIPLTAITAAFIYNKKRKNNSSEIEEIKNPSTN